LPFHGKGPFNFARTEAYLMRRHSLLAAAALLATPFVGSPASAAPCVEASVAVYEAAGFSCNVGPVTFSDFNVSTLATGSGFVQLGNFFPFISGNEFGLALHYISTTGLTPNSSSDVFWGYNVSGAFLSDAFLMFAGNTTGTGQAQVSEVLSNGVTLSLNQPGAVLETFAPIAALSVIKNQFNFAGPNGSASTPALVKAFSVSPVPLPGGAVLMGTALAGSLGGADFVVNLPCSPLRRTLRPIARKN
jgi:hypothetical protein